MTPVMPDCCLRFLGEAERRPRMRLLSLLFLFERIRDVPGDIVELGVGSGESLRVWLHFLQEHVSSFEHVLWGFDTFAGFPSFTAEDGALIPAIGKRVGGETEIRDRSATEAEVRTSLLAMHRREHHKNVFVKLARGDIAQELPKYARQIHPALVFCDADTYAPTKCALDVLWPLLSHGGLFVFDEYGQEAWPGETKAVDDFVARERLMLMKLTMESGPTAYVVKLS